MVLESKLIKEWIQKGLRPSKDFEFFTKRDYAVFGKVKGQEAIVEYECPYCKHCATTHEVELEKTKTGKFKKLKFKCAKCEKPILVEPLKKKEKKNK